MKLFKSISTKSGNFGKKLSAMAIGGFVAGASSTAHAQGEGIGAIVESAQTEFQEIPNLITIAAYIGGAVLAFGGILSVKQHVDNPQQKPLREGLVRLVAGGLLLGAPVAFNALAVTLGVDGNEAPEVRKFNELEGF